MTATDDVAGDAKRAGEELEQSTAIDVVARIGLVTYGVVHLVLAWLALQLALGHSTKSANTTGAMRELADQPLGRPLLWAVTAGMFLLVVWRVVEAAFGHREHRDSGRTWRRVLSAGKAVVYGVIGTSALRVATGHHYGHGPKGLTARVLGWPAGPALVVAAGVAVLGYGIGLVVIGWKEKFADRMDHDGTTGAAGTTYRWLGRVGYIVKGCAFGVVAVLLAYAGATHDPQESGGLDQALQRLLQQPFGPVLVAAVGIGLACFGLFCFARSAHLDR